MQLTEYNNRSKVGAALTGWREPVNLTGGEGFPRPSAVCRSRLHSRARKFFRADQ